jgi:hypothetical protein
MATAKLRLGSTEENAMTAEPVPPDSCGNIAVPALTLLAAVAVHICGFAPELRIGIFTE